MIEPTDEQVAVFKEAWHEQDKLNRHRVAEWGDRTRAGLRAVLNMK